MEKIVVCGYGTVGRKVVEELKKVGVDLHVIDRKEEVFRNVNFKYIVGDSKNKDVLKAAEVDCKYRPMPCIICRIHSDQRR